MMETLRHIAVEFWVVFAEMSPYLLFGVFVAGLGIGGDDMTGLGAAGLSLLLFWVSYFQENSEAYLFGAHITPLLSASTHIHPDPQRLRKLLLNRDELNKIIGAVERKGYSVLPLSMYWKRGRVKLEIGIGRGKKQFDKRAVEKERDWGREKQRELKKG